MTEVTLSFSRRELEVMELLARGMNFTEIARSLELSPRTCRVYAESARKKLGVKYARELPLAYHEATGESLWPE